MAKIPPPKKDQRHPQQPAAAPEPGQQHQHRRPQLTQGVGEKAHAREKDRRGVQAAQSRPGGQPEPPQRLPRQLCGRQKQQIVDD